jgi:LPS-assembly lipoprotein
MRPAAPFRFGLISCLVLALAACGFQLRGAVELPYQRLYIALAPNLERGAELRRQIRASQPQLLVEEIQEADAVFRELDYRTDRIIAAINAQGRAREYQLRLSYAFRVEDNKGAPLSPTNEIILTREVTYDDNQLLAKDQEENFLWQDMNKDLVQQILRRLATIRPQAVEVETEAVR